MRKLVGKKIKNLAKHEKNKLKLEELRKTQGKGRDHNY